MAQVKLHDKVFRISIPEERILHAVEQVSERLNEDMKGIDKPLFLSVLNGSFMFTSDLLKNVNFTCEVSFIKLSSYDGVCTSGNVRQLIGLNGSIEGRTVIVVEDIVDSGNTLEVLVKLLKEKNPATVKVATLLYKPDAYKKDLTIDYYGIAIPNDFIVGYGLDYNELGRNLKDIYTLVEPE